MRLEDALLYLVLDTGTAGDADVAGLAERAIAGGADVIQLRGMGDEDAVRRVLDVCRREDALAVVAGDAGLAAEVGADGVHLDSQDGSVGVAKTIMGADGMLGVTTRTLNEARLALEVGADYLLHYAGGRCVADFAAIGRGGGGYLYAAGIDTADIARHVVEGGVFRLCVESTALEMGNLTEEVAVYARVLGREV